MMLPLVGSIAICRLTGTWPPGTTLGAAVTWFQVVPLLPDRNTPARDPATTGFAFGLPRSEIAMATEPFGPVASVIDVWSPPGEIRPLLLADVKTGAQFAPLLLLI